MANLVAITFDSPTAAGAALAALREVQDLGQLDLEDTAVLVKDQDGQLRIQNEASGAVEKGAVAGGMIGLCFTAVFPLAGLALGTAGGALVGRLLHKGVDQKFAKDLGEAMQPGSSALCLIVRWAIPAVTLQALEPYKGTVYQTTLAPEVEDELRRVLS